MDSPPGVSTPSRRPTLAHTPSPLIFGPRNPYKKQGFAHRYPAEHLGNPSPLDRWLKANISVAPPRRDPQFLTTALFAESVDCKITMRLRPAVIDKHHHDDDPFTDVLTDERYVLLLTVKIIGSGVLSYHQTSPSAVLGRWSGEKNNLHAPDWCRSLDVNKTLEFKQPRLGMAEYFAYLASTRDNQEEGTSNRLLKWAKDASIISQFARPLPSKCVTPVCRPVPYNLRKRRPTTEFMSAADAAKVRSGLCAASPCLRRSKRLANLSNKKPVY